MFLLLYFVARWATQTDPQILRLLLTAARLRAQYDPMKFSSDCLSEGMTMLKLSRIFKNYEETGSLNEQVNLYGFVGPHVFLTKSGRARRHPRSSRCRLRVPRRRDDRRSHQTPRICIASCSTKTTASTSTSSSATTKPSRTSSTAIPSSMPRSRTASRYLGGKADTLFSLSIYYVVLFEGFRTSRHVGSRSLEFPRQPRKALGESAGAFFRSEARVVLDDREIAAGEAACFRRLASFHSPGQRLSVCSACSTKQEAFRVLKRTLNFASGQTRTRQAQARHLPRLLPLRIPSRMPPRPPSRGRLLRQSSDAQRTFRAELSR